MTDVVEWLCDQFVSIDAEISTEIVDIEVLENCERCGHLMPEGCIGWCADCGERESKAAAHEDFFAWGGWRRASAAVECGEPDPGPGTTCGGDA